MTKEAQCQNMECKTQIAQKYHMLTHLPAFTSSLLRKDKIDLNYEDPISL